jgi:hypothetical protein
VTWRLLAILAIAALAIAARGQACVCSPNWPSVKQEWRSAQAVFLGTVTSADPDGDAWQTEFREQAVSVRVDEAFKGVSRGQTVELHQGATDCDAKFRTGQRAVFYLHPGTKHGSWQIYPCQHAIGSAEAGGDDLTFLRGLPGSDRGTRLAGTVELYEDSPSEAFRRVGGVPNLKVRISGASGLVRQAVTNEAGFYQVYGLPPGKYTVDIEAPAGLKVRLPVVSGSASRRAFNDASAELGSDGGVGIDFVLQADTRVSGRVLDARGEPVIGTCIDLEPVAGRGENGARFSDCSKAGGAFEMSMMPPGKYWLIEKDELNTGGFKSHSTLYYPGVRDRGQAAIVAVEAGKYLEHLDVRLPAAEKRYRVAGRMQFSDGIPVANANVIFTSPQHGYTETTSTGADGLFTLSVVAGMDGRLSGEALVLQSVLKSCPQFQVRPLQRGIVRWMDADPVVLSGDSERNGLVLQLPFPSCHVPPSRRR